MRALLRDTDGSPLQTRSPDDRTDRCQSAPAWETAKDHGLRQPRPTTPDRRRGRQRCRAGHFLRRTDGYFALVNRSEALPRRTTAVTRRQLATYAEAVCWERAPEVNFQSSPQWRHRSERVTPIGCGR